MTGWAQVDAVELVMRENESGKGEGNSRWSLMKTEIPCLLLSAKRQDAGY